MQVMEAEGGNSARVALNERIGPDLSIPELCFALKAKLAQATDSQGCVSTRSIFRCYLYDDL